MHQGPGRSMLRIGRCRDGSICNADVRKLLGTIDALRASRQIKAWRDLGLLVVANPLAGKRFMRYTKPGGPPEPRLLSNAK